MQTLNEFSKKTLRDAILGMFAELLFAGCIILCLAIITSFIFKVHA